MRMPPKKSVARRLTFLMSVLCCVSCLHVQQNSVATYKNPIAEHSFSNVICYGDNYYLATNNDEEITLFVGDDFTNFANGMPVCHIAELDINSGHVWGAKIFRILEKWYICFSADDGNTDNQHLYILENEQENPFLGTFRLLGRIKTDAGDNRAISPYLFENKGSVYLLWSGWNTRRQFDETQIIYIARLKRDMRTLDSERVMLSAPLYEWERQCIRINGERPRYPIFVNESPAAFIPHGGRRVYILYNASYVWSSYTAIGMLSANVDADLLDVASWTKIPVPVFASSVEDEIFSPSEPQLLQTPDGLCYFLYTAFDQQMKQKTLRAQPVQMMPDTLILPKPASTEILFQKVL